MGRRSLDFELPYIIPPRTDSTSKGTNPPVAVREAPVRNAQLVGKKCIHCGERIPSDFDGHICSACGSPVHNHCGRPGHAPGRHECGAAAS